MNTYKKYCPNVFIAQCEEQYQKGDIIEMSTKYGQTHEAEVWNFLHRRDGLYHYSVVRIDGFNAQERARRKAERLETAAANAEKRANAYYQASNEGKEFLSLGEPIKVGHHSEKRHRALIDRNWARMGKSVAESEKAEEYASRAAYWKSKENVINLSMPESIEFYAFKLEQAKAKHEGMKNGTIERAHSMSLQYANRDVKEATANLETAIKLWGDQE